MWRSLPPAQSEANLEKAIELVKAAGASPILFGVGPLPGFNWPHAKEFPPLFKRVASKHRVPLLPDYLQPVLGKPEFNQKDLLHPNGAGQKEIAGHSLSFIKKALKIPAQPK
jgi:acyl-CoA thioesterase-1